jgi:DME family drug/metabolite transporter
MVEIPIGGDPPCLDSLPLSQCERRGATGSLKGNPNLPILWGLMAAVSFSIGQTLISQSLRYSNATTAAWFTSGASGLILWLIALSNPMPEFTGRIILGASAAALFSPFLARILLYMAYTRLGLSRPTVVAGTSPVWATILAILFLGEPLSVFIALGTLATTGGVVLLVYEKLPRTDWKKIHLTFALFAAICFGARDVVGRFSVQGFASPLVAAALVPTIASILLSCLFFIRNDPFRFHLGRKALPGFCIASLLYVNAYFSMFTALHGSRVVFVTAAIHAAPLFTLILSYLFLRKQERLSVRVVGGAVLVVMGVTAIALARHGA